MTTKLPVLQPRPGVPAVRPSRGRDLPALPPPRKKVYKGLGKAGYQLHHYVPLIRSTWQYSRDEDMAAHPFPRLIQLQTINACNAECVMCPYPMYKDVFARGRMDDDLYDKIVDEIAAHPEVRTFIPMLQNEPFVDVSLFEKIRRFKERTDGRVAVELVTNGAFLSEENVEAVRRAGVDILDISLDAFSKETYEALRKGLDYDQVLEGVQRVIDADLPETAIFVRMIRLKHNEAELRSFLRHWRKKGVPVFVYPANSRSGTIDDFEETMRLRREDISVGERIFRGLMRSVTRGCPVPFASAYILHDGDVLMCTQDWARKEIVGNVREASLAEIWNGPRMREIRRLVSERRYDDVDACRDCTVWKDGWV